MPDLLEIVGSSAGGGILGAIAAFFGLKTKINNLEKRQDRQDDKVVWRDTCIATHKAIDCTLERIESKLDRVLELK